MKTSELIGPALDWAVAKCGELLPKIEASVSYPNNKHYRIYTKIRYDAYGNARPVSYSPSTEWAQGGPIIEREALNIVGYDAHDADKLWEARRYAFDGTLLHNEYGPTPLVAAMRCYVASKLGDEVEIPEELK